MDVYRTPADSLDTLVVGSLQPPADFTALARRALGDLAAALRERRGRPDAAAPRWRVLKVAKVSAGGGAGAPAGPSSLRWAGWGAGGGRFNT